MRQFPTLLKVGEAALSPRSIVIERRAEGDPGGPCRRRIVANTRCCGAPRARKAALQFYQSSIGESSVRHHRWAAGHYGKVARQGRRRILAGGVRGGVGRRFHRTSRASAAAPSFPAVGEGRPCRASLEFIDLPCIEGDFVTVKAPRFRHPTISGPIAYLGGHALAPLLRELPAGLTPIQNRAIHGRTRISRSTEGPRHQRAGCSTGDCSFSHGAELVPTPTPQGRFDRGLADEHRARPVRGPCLVRNEVDLPTLRILTDDDLKELGLPFGPPASVCWRPLQADKSLGTAEAAATAGGAKRRQLTVLFCDISSGSPNWRKRVDPEVLQDRRATVRRRVRRLHRAL